MERKNYYALSGMGNRTRKEVLDIVARISDYATEEGNVMEAWDALLGDEHVGCFRHIQKRSMGALNRYRIAAIVHYMCEIGLYQIGVADVQECKNASFRRLCQLLFSDMDAKHAELYRRNCLMYSYEEDECIILNAVRHE